MRARGVVLGLFGVFGAVHVVGVLFGAPLLPSAPLLAWAALVAYAALAALAAPPDHAAPPAVRWPLFGGLAAFGMSAYLQWQTADSAVADGPTYLTVDLGRPDDAELWTAMLREAAPLLVACGLFAGAAFAAHARARRPGRTVAGRSIVVIGCTLAAGVVAAEIWSLPGPLTGYDWRLPVTVLLPLAAFLALVLAAGAAAAHGGGGWVAVAGLGLLALLALGTLDTMLFSVPRPDATLATDGFFVESGYLYSAQAVAVAGGSGSDLVGAVLAAAQLAAVGAVTAGLTLIRYAATPARG